MSKFLDKDGLEYFWTLIKAYVDTHGEEIHIGRTPPTNENIKIWIDTSGDGVPLTVTGISPLAFTNAVAENITSLIQYGKCVQNGTPTPEAPVDIVCNNGALRMVHRSGLPSGYKLLEYVGSSGAAYVVTNVFLASTDVIEAEFRNSSTTGYGSLYGVFKLGDSSALYANQTYYGYDESNNKVDTGLRVNTDWHSSRHDFVNGTLMIDNTTVTFTPFEFANTTQNAVLARYYNGSYGYIWKGFIRKFKVTRGGEVICDLLPAKNESGEAGLYDLISGTFYTATGGTLLEGDEVNDYELAAVGDHETLIVGTQTATVANLYAVGNYKDEQDIITGAITRRVGVKVLDGTESWQKLSVNGYYVEIDGMKVCNPVEAGFSTHFIGTAAETSSMPDGSIELTHTSTPAGAISIRYNAATTVEDFKAFLAGTPIIVLYPLEEEQTEQVDPQPIMANDGNNVIIVSSAVGEVELKVEYLGVE